VSRENVDVVRRWWAGFNADGVPPLALCDEGIEISNPPRFPVRGPYIGHDGVRQWATEVWDVFDDLRMEVEEVIDAEDDETVVSVQRIRGVMRHTKLPWDIQWAGVLTLREGRVVRAQGYMTRAKALEAVGLSE
jgi:ketosteroid isomerase-like protein